jgi:hypothetical protein
MQQDIYNQLPQFNAADLHNFAVGSPSLFKDPTVEDSFLESIPKFIQSTIYSGANELYNIGGTVGSMFTTDEFKSRELSNWLQEVDTDLLGYYQKHQGSVDVAGFMVSSLVPGLGGVKGLRMAQTALRSAYETGKVGGTLGRAVGLLTPQRDKYIQSAITELTASNSPFSLLRGNVLKTLGAGLTQNILEAAAFETAVGATMYNSPTMSAMDASDVFWNGVMFTGIGGVFGGAVSGALGYGAIKKGVAANKKALAPYETIIKPSDKSSASEQFLMRILDRDRVPAVAAKTGDVEHDAIVDLAVQSHAKTTAKRELEMLEQLNTLAGKDLDVANILHTLYKTAPKEDALGIFLQSTQVARLGKKIGEEKLLSKLQNSIKDPLDIPEETVVALEKHRVRYLNITGEQGLKVTDSAPQVVRLADTLKPGERITVAGNKVYAGKRIVGTFSLDKNLDIYKATPQTIEAYRLWTKNTPPLLPGHVIESTNIPLLEKAFREGTPDVVVKFSDAVPPYERTITSQSEMLDFLKEHKVAVAQKIHDTVNVNGNIIRSQEQLAAIVNVRSPLLSGEILEDSSQYFADEYYAARYTQNLVAKGLHKVEDGIIDITNTPSALKIGYNLEPVVDREGNQLIGEMLLQQKQREYQDTADRVFATYIPSDMVSHFPVLSNEDVYYVELFGPGRGFFSTSNSSYTSLGNKAEHIGTLTTKAMDKSCDAFRDKFNSLLSKVAADKDAALEYAVINQRVRAIPEDYILAEGEQKLILKSQADFEETVMEAAAAGKDTSKIKAPEITADAPLEIPITNALTYQLIKEYISRDAERVGARAAIKSLTGAAESRKSGVFYPIPPNTRDYKFFATVTDESITGIGRTRTLYAQSERQLDELVAAINKTKPASWVIRSKKETEEYFKKTGQFRFDETFHDVGFDAELKRLGASSPEIISTDPYKIVEDFLNHNLDQERYLVRQLVTHKYQPQIDTLKTLGDKYVNLATSQFGSSRSLVKYAENLAANPYMDYVKTMLGIPAKGVEYGWWFNTQKLIDDKISSMYEGLKDAFQTIRDPNELVALNGKLKEYGYNGVGYDEVIERWANYTAPKGMVKTFAQKANALLAALTLRLDHLNAANNIIGSHVLYYSELKSIIRAIEKGDEEAVGRLTKLAKIQVPGTGDYILSPTKIHAAAMKNYFNASPEIKQLYRDKGYITSISDQFQHILDDVTMTGRETVQEFGAKVTKIDTLIRKLAEGAKKGEKWTGNTFAEEYNRFIAADSARQIMQIAVDKGIITEGEMWANVATFVRRTQGTYEAFMRPAAFHGPVGQMIGLFQTYQFNLMQQLFRHIAEGDMKDAMLMMGLQGTIYGLQGMPAFNAINTHVFGTMSGNPKHRDLYTSVYDVAGDSVADWLMYGSASNILGLAHEDLKTNLYTRGDINPRQLTILPTSIEDVPIVNAAAKMFGGVKKAFTNVANGGNVWQSFLQGVEHSSVNRPLAGWAQIAQGLTSPAGKSFSTSNKGNVVAANDLVSLANLSRLVGGKPFDEAVTRDLAYRVQVYDAADSRRRDILGDAIKTAIVGGGFPTNEQVAEFAESYLRTGGDQAGFNRFMMRQIKDANKDQTERLIGELKSPALQKLQRQLGGIDPYEESSLESPITP